MTIMCQLFVANFNLLARIKENKNKIVVYGSNASRSEKNSSC